MVHKVRKFASCYNDKFVTFFSPNPGMLLIINRSFFTRCDYLWSNLYILFVRFLFIVDIFSNFSFHVHWRFMDPLTTGDYPHTMRSLVGNRLPKFSKEQSKMVKGSFDFIGLNYYTANYVRYAPNANNVNASYLTDAWAMLTSTSKFLYYFL